MNARKSIRGCAVKIAERAWIRVIDQICNFAKSFVRSFPNEGFVTFPPKKKKKKENTCRGEKKFGIGVRWRAIVVSTNTRKDSSRPRVFLHAGPRKYIYG